MSFHCACRAICFSIGVILLSASCSPASSPATTENDQEVVSHLLDSFHRAAARADFDPYFDFYTSDAIFTGTDATERWDKQQFMDYAKPYFDKGKAWDFHPMQREIYFSGDGNTAWFDELLDTRMKICRGSGVLVKENGQWKIAQYILSATVPNTLMDSLIKWKAPIEDSVILRLRADKSGKGA